MKKDNSELKRTLKFVLFSASAGIIQIASFALFNEVFHLEYWLSYLISLVLSILWNFTFNRKFTFQSAKNVPQAMFMVFLFYVPFTPLTTLLEKYLTGIGWNEYLVTGINMALNLSLEYLWDRYVVYRDSIDTNEEAVKEKEKEQQK
ncbi:MAG: GtrA family protein [Lachnospiraceae bacterium]|nr:GtrA family protein [Candidatus Hippenecus merdae]